MSNGVTAHKIFRFRIAEFGLFRSIRNPNSAIRNSSEWLANPAGLLSPGSEALRMLLATLLTLPGG